MIEIVRLQIRMINREDKTRNKFVLYRRAYYHFFLVFSKLGVNKSGVSGCLILIFHGFRIKDKWFSFLLFSPRNFIFLKIKEWIKVRCTNELCHTKRGPRKETLKMLKKNSLMQLISLIITCLTQQNTKNWGDSSLLFPDLIVLLLTDSAFL